jgi:hypothetical protein
MPYRTKGIRYWDILDNLNLTGNLKLLLDAGDSRSYDGSSQTWEDLSPGDYDYYRGGSAAALSDDPTFNGVSGGLSENEYFSLDGGDYFGPVNSSGVDHWTRTMHQDNAKFSIVMWYYMSATPSAIVGLCGTQTADNANGFSVRLDTAGRVYTYVYDGTIEARAYSSANNLSIGWNFIGFSLNEATPLATFYVNGVNDASSLAYTIGVSNAGSTTLKIGTKGSTGSSFVESGSRYGTVAIWEGRTLTQAEFASIYSFPQVTFSQSVTPQSKIQMVGY